MTVVSIHSILLFSDATVQVAALIVLGCILASEPVIPETKETLLKRLLNTVQPESSQNKTKADDDYADFSSDDEDYSTTTAILSNSNNIPWLLDKCLVNLNTASTPAPVKLESLQLLTVMSRNYFATIMADHVILIAKALENSLLDKYTELRLHAGRAVDFLGPAMDRYFGENGEQATGRGVQFWLILLNGPLIALLQDEKSAILRAVGCDCLGSIGAKVFERLPVSKIKLLRFYRSPFCF